MTDARPTIGFIGAGRTATALALGLSRCGYDVVAVASRSHASALELASRLPGCHAADEAQEVVERAGCVFITTPDEAIRSVVHALRWRPGVAVLHCSGALSRDQLASAAAAGAQTGCLHPLQSFAARAGVADLRGVYFAVEAEAALNETLRAMVEALGGHIIALRAEDRALYHASAVLASNYVVTLLSLSAGLWQTFGHERDTALQALLPLLRGVVTNLESAGLPDALTGPIARGDVESVRRHVNALLEMAPEALAVYKALGLETLPLALAKGGLDDASCEALRTLLESGNASRAAVAAASAREGR